MALVDRSNDNLLLPYRSGPYQWRDCKTPKEILDKCTRTKPQWLSETEVVVHGEVCKLSQYGMNMLNIFLDLFVFAHIPDKFEMTNLLN